MGGDSRRQECGSCGMSSPFHWRQSHKEIRDKWDNELQEEAADIKREYIYNHSWLVENQKDWAHPEHGEILRLLDEDFFQSEEEIELHFQKRRQAWQKKRDTKDKELKAYKAMMIQTDQDHEARCQETKKLEDQSAKRQKTENKSVLVKEEPETEEEKEKRLEAMIE